MKPDLTPEADKIEQYLKSAVHRRYQVLGHLTQEKNRLGPTNNPDVRNSIKQVIDFYKKQLKELNQKITKANEEGTPL